MEICIVIGGQQRCFVIPLLVAIDPIPPPPGNYPELELAATVLALVNVVQPVAQNSELVKELAGVSERFIQQVQSGLPDGVKIVQGSVGQTTRKS
jgi:hypothetical protein